MGHNIGGHTRGNPLSFILFYFPYIFYKTLAILLDRHLHNRESQKRLGRSLPQGLFMSEVAN